MAIILKSGSITYSNSLFTFVETLYFTPNQGFPNVTLNFSAKQELIKILRENTIIIDPKAEPVQIFKIEQK